MAKRIEDTGETVSFTFENQMFKACVGDTVAAALVLAGQRQLRSSVVSGEPRGIFCMMGTCFDCLVEIDGTSSVQACRTLVRDGMIINRQHE
ncbi:MAG: (2Fe-2S)-binding protein [Granulosicoccus sp.]